MGWRFGWLGVLRNRPNLVGGFFFDEHGLAPVLLEFAEVVEVAIEGSLGSGAVAEIEADLFDADRFFVLACAFVVVGVWAR